MLPCVLAMTGASSRAFAMPSPLATERPVLIPLSGLTRLAQAVPAPATPPPVAQAAPTPRAAASTEPIGNVATLQGSAIVIRNKASTPLQLKDDIYKNDILQTSANSALGVTFNDATTFNLTAEARFEIDDYIYEEGGGKNAALFKVALGKVAFAASAVAKTGDMKIETPTVILGIRGTTGLIEVPANAAATGSNNVAVKLYPDADGKVGRIELNGRDGTRIGFLNQGVTGFSVRAGAGGRFAAVPLQISQQQAQRDQVFVRQLHATQNVGRRIVTQQRALRRANPGRLNNPARQPGPQRRGLQQRQGSQPQPGVQPQGLQNGPAAPGARRPGVQNRPALRRAGPPPKGKPKRRR